MARIFFSTISGVPNSSKLPSFYEGLVKSLVKNGNEVLVMITNDFMTNLWSKNLLRPSVNVSELNQKIIDFNPDLVITCNNSLYEAIINIVSCPVVIYGTDSPALFIDKENLKRNISKYHILLPTKEFIPMVRQYFGSEMKSLNILPFATDFQAEDLPLDKNISFIGTNFQYSYFNLRKKIVASLKDGTFEDLKAFFKYFRQNPLSKPEEYFKSLKTNSLNDISHVDLLNILSSNSRLQTLSAISDLGLVLYGGHNWLDVCDFSLDLVGCFDGSEISSVKDNQNVYNSSKIAINISHAQAGKTFSWRVRDIMACNSALVSDYREELFTKFSEYVKIPTYQNPFEARKICRDLLNDEPWRRDLVQGSQLEINERHRFDHRIKDLQDMYGINLFVNTQKSSSNNFNFILCTYDDCSGLSYLFSKEGLRDIFKIIYFKRLLYFSKNLLPRHHLLRCLIRKVRFGLKKFYRMIKKIFLVL